MKKLLTRLAANREDRWGTVIWAGLGYGTGLAGVRALDAERYVYLEPNPALRNRLQQKYVFSDREVLLGNALWSSQETRLFHVLSDPLRSTLIAPDRVLRAWPNLRLTEEVEVETESLASLSPAHATPGIRNNLLVLDVRGAEHEVLAATDEALLAQFSHVIVRRDSTDDVGQDSHWLRLLSERGYVTEDEEEFRTAGWMLFHRPRSEEAANAATDAAAFSVGTTSIGTTKEVWVARIQELESALEQARSEAGAQTALVLTQQEQIEALTAIVDLQAGIQAEKDRLQGHAETLETSVRELQASLEASNALHAQAEAEKAQLQGQVNTLQASIRELQSAVETSNATASQAAGALAQNQEALEQARQAARLGLKLQTLRENDLRDLQQRYQASLEVQERQHQMLVKLGERLGAASRYFHQLTDADRLQDPAGTAGAIQHSGAVVIDHGVPAHRAGKTAPIEKSARIDRPASRPGKRRGVAKPRKTAASTAQDRDVPRSDEPDA